MAWHGGQVAEDLGRAAPDHHQPVAVVLLLEVLDVVHHLGRQVRLVLAGLEVGGGQLLHVGLLEDRLHRLDGREEVLELAEVLLRQHPRLGGRLVGVVGEEVPAAEDDVVELGQRDELVDERRARVGPLAEANRPHLRERADGLRDPLPDRLDPSHEGGGDRAHPGGQDAELARRRADVDRFTCGLRERHCGSF